MRISKETMSKVGFLTVVGGALAFNFAGRGVDPSDGYTLQEILGMGLKIAGFIPVAGLNGYVLLDMATNKDPRYYIEKLRNYRRGS